MAMYKSLIFVFGILSSSLAFKIIKNETEILSDGKLRLTCVSDADYEWCYFKHKNKACEFKWTTDAQNVTTKNCNDFEDRLEFVGNYENYECAIEIDNITDEDAGEWKCELESYKKAWDGRPDHSERYLTVPTPQRTPELTTATIKELIETTKASFTTTKASTTTTTKASTTTTKDTSTTTTTKLTTKQTSQMASNTNPGTPKSDDTEVIPTPQPTGQLPESSKIIIGVMIFSVMLVATVFFGVRFKRRRSTLRPVMA